MAKRPLPNRCEEFLTIAATAGLSHPLGRALYACNRLQNGWPHHGIYCSMDDPLDVMKRTKESTAKKWLKHWKNGGHIQTLRSVEEHNRLRRIRDQRRRADYKARDVV